MDPNIAEALQQVTRAFSHYPRPEAIPHCTRCYHSEDVLAFLCIPDDDLCPEDLQPILTDGFSCWGTWPEVAYYLPRLLEFYATGQLDDDEELYAKLLIAARPEIWETAAPIRLSEMMHDDERQSIFWLVAAVLKSHLARADEGLGWKVLEELAFLAAFDGLLPALLRDLVTNDDLRILANLALLLCAWAECSLGFSAVSVSPATFLPENQSALDDFFSLPRIVQYLDQNRSVVSEVFGKQGVETVDLALEWALARQDMGAI